MVSRLLIVALLIALSSTAARADCTFDGKTYAEGEVVTRITGSCTCMGGELTKCSCFNWDNTTVPVGAMVFKVAQACRCLGPEPMPPLMDVNTDCVPLRPNVLSTPFRERLNGTDFGYNFNVSQVTVLNEGNFIPSVLSGLQAVWNIVDPCTSTPHWHPRGTEWYVVPKGKITTMFAEEKDLKLYEQDIIGPGLSVMPQGLEHTLINPTCKVINIFVFYNSPDPGRVNVPGINCDAPPAPVDGPSLLVAEQCKRIAECKKKCGL